jgi:hypothetical protein
MDGSAMAVNEPVNKREAISNPASQAGLDDLAVVKQRGKSCYAWFSLNATSQDPPVWVVGHQRKVLGISMLILTASEVRAAGTSIRFFVSRSPFFLLILSSISAIFMTALSSIICRQTQKKVPNACNIARCRAKSRRLHEDSFPGRQ